jgi:hypothetical protein
MAASHQANAKRIPNQRVHAVVLTAVALFAGAKDQVPAEEQEDY